MNNREAIAEIRELICGHTYGCTECQKEECAFYLAIKTLETSISYSHENDLNETKRDLSDDKETEICKTSISSSDGMCDYPYGARVRF